MTHGAVAKKVREEKSLELGKGKIMREIETGETVRFRLSTGRASRAAASRGIVVQSGALRSLVQFRAPLISGCSSERMWVDNTNLVVQKGKAH